MLDKIQSLCLIAGTVLQMLGGKTLPDEIFSHRAANVNASYVTYSADHHG